MLKVLRVNCCVWPFSRYENFGDVVAGYLAHVGQRPSALLLRLLHIWHHRCSAVGRITQAKVLHSTRYRQQDHQK